jgi:hypothetical protein
MISILIAALLAQQVSPPTAASTPSTTAAARVAGRIVNSLTGDAVAKAVVILRAHDPVHAPSYADETDAQGRFSIPDVEPGEYAIAVERAGFILESTGAVGAPGPTVKVDAGQSRNDLTLRASPLGVITGRILDADGEPARGANVEALHYVYVRGKKQLQTVSEVASGDRGDFRLFGLRAGTYYLKATGRQVAPFELLDNATVTYYPGGADSSRAVRIELRADEQMRGFDIRLQSSGAHSIQFQLPPGITVSPSRSYLLNGEGSVLAEGWRSGVGLGFGNIPPGSYEAFIIGLRADKSPGYARRHVEVADADVDGGTLEFVPGAAVTGTVRLEGNAIRDLGKLRVHLQSDFRDVTPLNPNATVHPDGSFTFEAVAPVAYDISIDRVTGVYLKTVRMGDQPLAQPRIDAAEKLEPLTVVLGADTGELQGIVKNSKGDLIARARADAIADGGHANRPDFNRSTFSDEKGQFKITDLPPGQYKIFAWENVPDGAPQDPEFRKPFGDQAVAVTIPPSARVNLNITAISATQVDRSLQ